MNMTALIKAHGKQSGWVRHGKREFLYSSCLRDWQAAVKVGAGEKIDEYAERHARLFGYINFGGVK